MKYKINEAAKNAWAEYFASVANKGENHLETKEALKKLRGIRDAETVNSLQSVGKAEWREALKGLLQEYPDAKVTVKPHGSSTEKLRALGRNEATKNRVDGYSDSFRQPTNMGPAMMHREKALMEKPTVSTVVSSKGRYARWMQQVQSHPENHALLVADNDRRCADLLERRISHKQHLKNLGICDD